MHTVLTGSSSVPGGGRSTAEFESELSYYSAFYVAFGLAALSVAPRAERRPGAVRALAAALFGGGVSRAAAWRRSGAPHPAQRALLALELGVPPVILALQTRATVMR